jgi:hypothetical protein
MSSISGVGGISMGGGMSLGAAGIGSAGAAGAPAGEAAGAGTAAATSGTGEVSQTLGNSLQEFTESFSDMNSIDILIMLMLMVTFPRL